jgi:hypothetical protein
MTLHRLRQTAFWGDYGTALARGLPAQRDKKSGHLLVERAGPFAPPMIFTIESLVGFKVLVTQSLREKLEAANFGDLTFKPTIKKHIVSIPWETWDREARLPWDANARVQGEPPEEGEPSNYVTRGKHSPEAASKMEEIWELVAPDLPFEIERSERVRAFHKRWHVTAPKGEHRGLFRPPGDGHILFVDEAGRRWFEREGQGWIDFDEVVIV